MARREEFSPSTAEDTTTRPARAGLAARAAETTLTPETALLTDETERVSTRGKHWSPGRGGARTREGHRERATERYVLPACEFAGTRVIIFHWELIN